MEELHSSYHQLPDEAVASVEPVISDIRKWLIVIQNFLMVNDTKTEALVVSSRYHHLFLPTPPSEWEMISSNQQTLV